MESAITAYEKAISEKANDVDYFADAYLLLMGLQVDEENLHTIRSDRVIHVPPMDADDINAIRVEFLQKPAADATQENLLNRLEDQIFAQSMVANISDESFGSSSGTALAYKLQPMKNQAAAKSRKFASAMNQRWRLIAAHPASKLATDDWMQITYRFTQNARRTCWRKPRLLHRWQGSHPRKHSFLSFLRWMTHRQNWRKSTWRTAVRRRMRYRRSG